MTTLSHTAASGRRPPLLPSPPRDRIGDASVITRLAALPTMSMPDLQRLWRDLHGTEPPRSNRKFLESRLAYRIQELAYGGLKPETKARLAVLADELGDSSTAGSSRRSAGGEQRLLSGTRLLREWQGVEHAVTVTDTGFEWQGRPYGSLSSVARSITSTRWNGPLFFGLRSTKGRAA